MISIRLPSASTFMKILFNFLFLIFIFSTIFDPMDKLLGLKTYLFIACMAYGVVFYITHPGPLKIPIKLLVYVLLIIFIPLLSITHYFFIDSSSPYQGFLLLKSYLFITLSVLIYITRIDIFRYLSNVLSVLSLTIIIVSIVVAIFPELFLPLYIFGNNFGIFSIDPGRDYGAAGTYFQMYFVTSSMIVISIAYYFDKWMTEDYNYKYLLLFCIGIIAMFLAGSRNNMLMAIALPAILFWTRSKNKITITLIYIIFFIAGLYLIKDQIIALFDPNEVSNFTKLLTLNDYIEIFSNNIYTFIFGEGLGAYQDWTGRGPNFVTELTYFEIIRNYGIIVGVCLFFLILYPIVYAFLLRPSYPHKHLMWAYIAYLIMSFTNPLFFSSMGMLILSALIASISLHDDFLNSKILKNI
jgi:hypothetical protein